MDSRAPSPESFEAPIILDRSRHPISRANIDTDALKVLYRLHKKGHTAYLVGGAVRDLLLGRRPADFDVSTDAHPNRIKKLFANAFLIGRRFRLAHIRFRGGKLIEVSTFRKKPEEGSEPEPQPGKSPETGKEDGPEAHPGGAKRVRKPIAFGTPREDAFRRDITINALFYDIATFSVIDYVGGLEDLKSRRIRIIGDPDVSYTEDPVRIWRVLRHAARLNFAIEEKTGEAIARHRHLLLSSPGSRLFEELGKDMKSGASGPLFELMHRYGILPVVLTCPIGKNEPVPSLMAEASPDHPASSPGVHELPSGDPDVPGPGMVQPQIDLKRLGGSLPLRPPGDVQFHHAAEDVGAVENRRQSPNQLEALGRG